jgi:hypothetical protein
MATIFVEVIAMLRRTVKVEGVENLDEAIEKIEGSAIELNRETADPDTDYKDVSSEFRDYDAGVGGTSLLVIK